MDSSVVVAAFASWHEHHKSVRRLIGGVVRIIEHCVLETYSVLTRLLPPHRSPAAVVRAFIQTRFPEPFLRLSTQANKDFVLGFPELGVTSGAAYDALVAATAAGCKAALVTCDRRAASVYESYGVGTKFLGQDQNGNY